MTVEMAVALAMTSQTLVHLNAKQRILANPFCAIESLTVITIISFCVLEIRVTGRRFWIVEQVVRCSRCGLQWVSKGRDLVRMWTRYIH